MGNGPNGQLTNEREVAVLEKGFVNPTPMVPSAFMAFVHSLPDSPLKLKRGKWFGFKLTVPLSSSSSELDLELRR